MWFLQRKNAWYIIIYNLKSVQNIGSANETIENFHPHISAILNIAEDHLDRYKDIEDYFNAKKNIYKNQNCKDFLILNYDNIFTNRLFNELKKNKEEKFNILTFSTKNKNATIYYNNEEIFYKNKKLQFNTLFKLPYLRIFNKFKKIIENRIFLISFIFIIFVYIAKIILISFTALIDDEAYYVLWTNHLPFGFFDHGAGIAYFLKLSLTIFGYNGFGARIGSVIFSILVSVFLYKFIKNERDENSAIISVILFNIIPFFSGLSLIVTIDTPMFYFIIFSIIAYYKSIFYDKKYFYLSGALIGFSILSKINL